MTPYLVSQFSQATLSNLVKECFGSEFPDIFHKPQIGYIYRYLKDLDAKSVLLEFEYVDKDYLEDYSLYYVKCFRDYGHRCARLHFFSKEVSHSELNKLIRQHSQKEMKRLQQSYLGYMVIKPLPKTFIGRTCLKNYPAFTYPQRQFLSKEYKVDLFGISLTVNSIAFQEQDKVVSACATTAIWSALHALDWKSTQDIPACSVITSNAINHINGSSNRFPNKELSNKQILRALDCERLKHHEDNLDGIEDKEFFETSKYLIDSRLPIIIGVHVYSVEHGRSLNLAGPHAVTLLGYKDGSATPVVYLHDDRLGPFVRASIIELHNYIVADDKPLPVWGLALQHKTDEGWEDTHEVLIPSSLIVPTQQKTRLSLRPIKNTCTFIISHYEAWLKGLDSAVGAEASGKLTFKIKLKEISQIRQEIIKLKFKGPDKVFLNNHKGDFLTGNYARLQWEACFQYDKKPIFRIYFDATEIPQGDPVSFIFVEDKKPADAVLTYFRQIANAGKSISLSNEKWNFFASFLKQLKDKESPFDNYLDQMYGDLRVPKYLKPQELIDGDISTNDSVQRYYESYLEHKKLLVDELKADDNKSYLIWAIAHDGSLLMGKEIANKGHPSLTGFKPARIAGEIRVVGKNKDWLINAQSGRYSSDYLAKDSKKYLGNALKKLQAIFPNHKGKITIEPKK